MASGLEYRVLELRGEVSGDDLERTLNEHATAGWRVKAVTPAGIAVRLLSGAVTGLLVTLERDVP